MYTDAIWRACRIILDVRLHRGEISVDDAIDFLVEQTGFERPNADGRGPSLHLHAHLPAVSYLLGKVILLRLRDDEQHAAGRRVLAARFHDALLSSGSIPVSFHRRLAGVRQAVESPA